MMYFITFNDKKQKLMYAFVYNPSPLYILIYLFFTYLVSLVFLHQEAFISLYNFSSWNALFLHS